MKSCLRFISIMMVACPIWASYQYYFADSFTAIDSSKWTQNGSVGPTTGGLGGGGSLISRIAVPDGTSDYEVSAILRTRDIMTYTNSHTLYVRATADAWEYRSGSYYAVHVLHSLGSAQVNVVKRAGGIVTVFASFFHDIHDGTCVRLVARDNILRLYIDSSMAFTVMDSDIPSGQPGVGVEVHSAGNTLGSVQIGSIDRVSPPVVDLQSTHVSARPRGVDLAWPTVTDDANGIGLAGYVVYRDSIYLGGTTTATLFTDETVSGGSSYTYSIEAYDQHGNYSQPATFTVPVPSGPPDQRRVGARAGGSYWGAAGEQIDLFSGNLNFSVPVFKVVGRGGWGVTFALSYNSQVWRQDGGATWLVGGDVGYGLGWRLQAGTIRPVYSGSWGLQYLVFTDATGAEYRLDANTSGLWTSHEGTYVTYDANASRLYFPDGSFWVMGAESSAAEADAGTLHPTLMQDSNGNQVDITYDVGAGVRYWNSSARIVSISDARSASYSAVYNFGYTALHPGDAIRHVTRIYSQLAVERYDLTYGDEKLTSPFGDATEFGAVSLLKSVKTEGLDISHVFDYSAGTAELAKVTTPLGGTLQWDYRTYTYGGGRSYREVQNRYLRAFPNAALQTWNILPDSGSEQHASTTVADTGAGTRKTWWFRSDAPYTGFPGAYEEQEGWGTALVRKDYTWSQDGAQTPFLSAAVTTLNPNTSYAAASKVTQAVDVYGNIVQSQLYDYGNMETPARTYTYQYLSDSNYIARYIRNRLTSATVTGGGGTSTLATYTYDAETRADRPNLRYHDPSYGTSFQYRGNVTRLDKLGSVTTYAHDIGGVVTTITDGDGRSLAVTSSADTEYSLPNVLTPNGNDNLATSVTYSSSWAVTSVTGPNAASTTTTYDDYGRPSKTKIPDGAETVYTYTYYPSENTQTATLGTRWKKTTQDGFGRVTKVESGHDGTTTAVIETRYAPCGCSPLGKVELVSRPHAPGGAVYWTAYKYDGSGRTLKVLLPDGGSTTQYTYAGNRTTVTDPAGKWKTFTTDSAGNLTTVEEPDPKDPSGASRLMTYYTYNRLNQLTKVEMW